MWVHSWPGWANVKANVAYRTGLYGQDRWRWITAGPAFGLVSQLSAKLTRSRFHPLILHSVGPCLVIDSYSFCKHTDIVTYVLGMQRSVYTIQHKESRFNVDQSFEFWLNCLTCYTVYNMYTWHCFNDFKDLTERKEVACFLPCPSVG